MYISTFSLTPALDGGGWSTPRPGQLTPGKNPVPTVYKDGWAPGPVWTGAENLVLTAVRSQDRPGRSGSLYRLNHPDPQDFIDTLYIVSSLRPNTIFVSSKIFVMLLLKLHKG
jgi:hypothetical protein